MRCRASVPTFLMHSCPRGKYIEQTPALERKLIVLHDRALNMLIYPTASKPALLNERALRHPFRRNRQ